MTHRGKRGNRPGPVSTFLALFSPRTIMNPPRQKWLSVPSDSFSKAPTTCRNTPQPSRVEQTAVILIIDMAGYTRCTSGMSAGAIRDFLIDYHCLVSRTLAGDNEQEFPYEPFAGDAGYALFKGPNRVVDALDAAERLALAVAARKIQPTRIGLFSGSVIEARFGATSLKVGAGFSAATRLEQLCGHFGTALLMDREVAAAQTDKADQLVSIGKVTPRHYTHPIHAFTLYRPGINGCPEDADPVLLGRFIRLKNKGMEFFTGNRLKGISPDFAKATRLLKAAAGFFEKTCQATDPATRRILDFIREHPFPPPGFFTRGMEIEDKSGDVIGGRLFHLSQELFRSLDKDFYEALVVNTEWEHHFQLKWFSRGDVIIRAGERPDGVYYITKGMVNVTDENGKMVAVLEEGDIFGEMAYFTQERLRTASVTAVTDLVVRKISGGKFNQLPIIRKIFKPLPNADGPTPSTAPHCLEKGRGKDPGSSLISHKEYIS